MPKVFLDTGKKTESVKWDSVDVSNTFIQTYNTLYECTAGLHSLISMKLLLWISINMDIHNGISLNKENRMNFASTVGSVSDSAVKKAISELKRSKLIVSMSDPGKRSSTYLVNPAHFWRTGSQQDRVEAIKAFTYKLKENEGN